MSNGVNLDGVEGATSKTATAYYRTEQGVISSEDTTDGTAYCGDIFCGQYYAAMQRSIGNQCVYVLEADYITVTDECDYSSVARVLTYKVGSTKYVYNYDRTTGELLSRIVGHHWMYLLMD